MSVNMITLPLASTNATVVIRPILVALIMIPVGVKMRTSNLWVIKMEMIATAIVKILEDRNVKPSMETSQKERYMESQIQQSWEKETIMDLLLRFQDLVFLGKYRVYTLTCNCINFFKNVISILILESQRSYFSH